MSAALTAEALRRALDNGEIVPYFQPLVELRSAHLVGFEVLARWCPPGAPPVFPDAFIPLAEQAGLIGPLTEHLLRTASAAAAQWPDTLQLAVNLSPLQLHERDLPERLRRAAEDAGFPLDRLVFEITEAALVGDLERARAVSFELKSLGAQLALDDFGAGHSGLRLLQSLPIDRLKIDASFVRSMTSHRESRKIVAAVIGLAQSLGLSSTAEGVECREQADLLRSLGCDFGQGWLFGRALATEQAAGLANRHAPDMDAPQPMAHIVEEVASQLQAVPGQYLGQLQALYDSAPVGFAFLDTQLRYRSVNARLATMHGRPVAEHLGRRVAELIPDLFPRLASQFQRALSGEAVTDYITRHPGDKAAEQVFLYSYQPVRDPAGEILGISVAVVDVETVQRKQRLLATVEQPAPEPAEISRLTPRLSQVLCLLADGRSVKQIARTLGLAPGTVKCHVARLYVALGARNRVEAVARAGNRPDWYDQTALPTR